MSYSANSPHAIGAYQTAAQNVGPLEAIIMLYSGAIDRVELAKTAIGEGRIEDRFNAIQKVFAIITGLQGQLDHEAGGHMAQKLDQFYTHICQMLTTINLRNDQAMCDQVIDKLSDMRDGWVEIAALQEVPQNQSSVSHQSVSVST